MTNTLNELIHNLENSINPNAAAGVDAVIHFCITGDDGGDWSVIIHDNKCKVMTGLHGNPRVIILSNFQTIKDIMIGNTDGAKAYFSGKIKLKGDLGFAQKIMSLFSG